MTLRVVPDRRNCQSRLLAKTEVLNRLLSQPSFRVTPHQVAGMCELSLDVCRRILDCFVTAKTLDLDASGHYYPRGVVAIFAAEER